MTNSNSARKEPAPSLDQGNPFNLLAYVLFEIRHFLEDEEDPGRAPRWIRITKAAQETDGAIGEVVENAVNGFAVALSYMVEVTLDIKDALSQTDAAKVAADAGRGLLTAATDVVNGVNALANESSSGGQGNLLDPLSRALDAIKPYLEYIPQRDDVERLGHELYRLLCIVQEPLPTKFVGTKTVVDEGRISTGTLSHIDVAQSGKVSLMQWAFENERIARGLGAGHSNEQSLKFFSSRRLWETTNDKLPAKSVGTYLVGEDMENVFDFAFDTINPRDLQELNELLERWGYELGDSPPTRFTGTTTEQLKIFQSINALPQVSGFLDNSTINRLINLDYDSKNLKRAKEFDPNVILAPTAHAGPLPLVNGDADHPQDESIEVQENPPGFSYYVARRLPPDGGGPISPDDGRPIFAKGDKGWISDSVNTIPGFVALESRRRDLPDHPNHLRGGIWSEGESASGRYFFAARHTEPWKAGRSGKPEPGALFGADTATSPPSYEKFSRIYQWLDVRALQPARPGGHKLRITLGALQRSLFVDRGLAGTRDSGRLWLEAYRDGFVTSSEGVFDFGTRRDRNEAVVTSEAEDAWFPDERLIDYAMFSLDDVARKRFWVHRRSDLEISDEVGGILVILEGKHVSAWDTDAYFDDVRVSYSFEPDQGSTS